MKTITEQIAEKTGWVIVNEVSDAGGQYQMFNDAGVECETGEFLFGLVKIMKPTHILETGTHKGVSTSYMGLAMKESGLSGRLDTIEHFEDFYKESQEVFTKLGLQSYVYGYKSSVDSFDPTNDYDLIFLDTEPERRFAELVRFYPYLKPGGFVFIHDLHRHLSQEPNEKFFGWPFGKLPDQIVQWIKEDKLRPFHFGTPRGLSGFYKVDPRDYKV